MENPPRFQTPPAARDRHMECQTDGRYLEEHEDLLKRLPWTLVTEHVGRLLEPVPPHHPGFQSLLRLVDTGRCWVKLSANPAELYGFQ